MPQQQTMILYGCKVQSDFSFPLRLPEEGEYHDEILLSGDLPADLIGDIRCGSHLYDTHGRRIFLYTDRPLDTPIAGQPYCYESENVARFYWRHGERRIYYERLAEGDAERFAFWFIHLFQPLYMTLEEFSIFFHSGAVDVDGEAIAFIAPSMGGKSTMTDVFLRRGHPLITDDILPLRREGERILCAPSFPYHRPFRAPETLGYPTDNYRTDFRRLKALYILEKGDPREPTLIQALHGFRKFEALKYLGLVYTFRFMTLTHNRLLGDLLNRVNVFRVTRPWSMERLDEVYQEIHRHAQNLSQGA